jgi:hypothetical protein
VIGHVRTPALRTLKTPATAALCHTSVSKWTLAAGATVTSKEKKERCAKVTGEVVYVTVDHLNLHSEGKWAPIKWKPKPEFAHCSDCRSGYPGDKQADESAIASPRTGLWRTTGVGGSSRRALT